MVVVPGVYPLFLIDISRKRSKEVLWNTLDDWHTFEDLIKHEIYGEIYMF